MCGVRIVHTKHTTSSRGSGSYYYYYYCYYYCYYYYYYCYLAATTTTTTTALSPARPLPKTVADLLQEVPPRPLGGEGCWVRLMR